MSFHYIHGWVGLQWPAYNDKFPRAYYGSLQQHHTTMMRTYHLPVTCLTRRIDNLDMIMWASWYYFFFVFKPPPPKWLIMILRLGLQIILFQFGLGANVHFVILELGYVLLTDVEFTVLNLLTLLRSHRFIFLSYCSIWFRDFLLPYDYFV